MTDRPDLAALIGSRICHDLVSPIGAIGNGVELIAMSGGQTSPELALIADSAATANAKLRYFRLAFGAGGSQRVSRAEVKRIVDEAMATSRLQVGWTSDADLARGDVKLAFLMVMCLETAMPWGGRINVTQAGTRWRAEAEAPRLKIDPGLWGFLQGPEPGVEITAASVQFAVLAEELRRIPRRFNADLSATRIWLEI